MADSSTSPQSLVGRSFASYDVVEKLGAGGMGVVYRAVDRKLGRNVALKLLPETSGTDPSARERFLREARAASALDHPNIGTIFGIEELPQGGLCIVMAYYEGKSLAERMARRRLGPAETIRIGIQVADGLAAAHAAGIIHRDVKPSNVMLTSSQLVKVVDFGLAKLVSGGGETLTKPASVVGTAAYMSPEQARGLPVDDRTDIWSLGVMLYHCLSETLPFRGPEALALLYSVVHDEPPPLEGVSPDLEAAIRKAMAKDAAKRFASMEEFASELRTIVHNMEAFGALETQVSVKVPAIRPVAKWPRAGRMAIYAAAATLFLAGAAALIPSLRQRAGAAFGKPAVSENHTTLAILPFSGGGDAEISAMARGLAQRLSARLTKLESLRDSLTILAPSESLAREIPDARHAMQKQGATLAIAGTLTRTGAAQSLVLEIYDRRRAQPQTVVVESALRDFVALEDRALEAVAQVLEIQAGPQLTAALWRTGAPVTAAYEPYLRGVGYMQRWDKAGNPDSARAEFAKAVSVDPQFALAHSGLAEAARTAYTSSKDPSDLQAALSSAKQAIRIDPKLAEAHVVMGRIYQTMGQQRDLAVIEFQRALELEPRQADAIQGMARAYEDLGREAEAEAAFKRGVALRPWSWSGYNRLASYYLRKKRYADAEAQFRKALELAPDNAAVYSNLGVTLKNQDKLAEAVKMYRRSIELEPGYQVLNNLAVLYYAERNFRESAEMYGKALEVSGKDFVVWGSRGQALLHGRGPRADVEYSLRKAVALGEQQLQVHPDAVDTLGLLAIYHALLGEKEAALARVNQAMTRSSVTGEAAVYCATAYELIGDRANAVRWAQKALDTGYPWKDLRESMDLDQLVRSSALRHSP